MFRSPRETPIALEVIATDDATGATATKPVMLNYDLIVRPYFWIPETMLEQHIREDGVRTHWADAGLVTLTDGDVIDYARIYADITTKIVCRAIRD